MSRRNAIIRRLTAVETLGCAQIICSDKTGTLTQNKMTVVEHFGGDETALARAMALCSDAELQANGEITGEPTECALVAYARKLSLLKNGLKRELPRVGEAPFDSGRKMMSTVHKSGSEYIQFTKGAPDEVLKLCVSYLENGKEKPMTAAKRAEILKANHNMAARALRVLMAARRAHTSPPVDFSPDTLERELCFVGLTGMIDPVRPEVKDAIERCALAGIRPIMITGDHIDTAKAIAAELDILKEGGAAISGSELSAMSDEIFEKVFMDISVYARVQPEHKVRISLKLSS
jgi:Ca2+-transporting ATPase